MEPFVQFLNFKKGSLVKKRLGTTVLDQAKTNWGRKLLRLISQAQMVTILHCGFFSMLSGATHSTEHTWCQGEDLFLQVFREGSRTWLGEGEF